MRLSTVKFFIMTSTASTAPSSQLDQLRQITIVVADTGDLAAIQRLQPRDATTNPSLITAAAGQAENRALLEQAWQQSSDAGTLEARLDQAIDWLTIQLGVQITQAITGRVSTEVDAQLSHDTDGTIRKAHALIAQYAHQGVSSDRILIKMAATWEGIEAARQLEAEGIHCNLTLLFGLHQAMACADAGVTLISPFVGRILDWYKKRDGVEGYAIEQDPGVNSVKAIYHYYKQHGYQTEIMGASFRSKAQVLALAGCDLLTISPNFLDELAADTTLISRQLSPDQAFTTMDRRQLDRNAFMTDHQQDTMSSDLLQSGIEGFVQARAKLVELLTQLAV